MEIGDAIILGLTWLANGGLVCAFWLADHALLLSAIPAFALLTIRAPREQRPFILAGGILGVLTAALVPSPSPSSCWRWPGPEWAR